MDLPDVMVIEPERHEDERGFFMETWTTRWLDALPVDGFVQDNQSYNVQAGTLRGLHFQAPPFAQAKLVRVLAGAVLDVVVDLRPGLPTFGRWSAVRLSSRNGLQLFIPEGFAHGFCSLEPETHVLYKVSSPWKRSAERGLRWDDPTLGIEWPHFDQYVITERDRAWPTLAAAAS